MYMFNAHILIQYTYYIAYLNAYIFYSNENKERIEKWEQFIFIVCTMFCEYMYFNVICTMYTVQSASQRQISLCCTCSLVKEVKKKEQFVSGLVLYKTNSLLFIFSCT